MLPRKIFKNLHSVVAILVLFEQFLRKFCLNFLPINLSVSPNIVHFVRTFSIMRALGVRLIVTENVQSYEKIVFNKNMFENGWWEDASPLDPPPPALITMSVTTTPTNPFGFSMMRQIVSQLF